MKLKITYKEFSMIIGILVAVIIVLTLWINNKTKVRSITGKMPIISYPTIASRFIEKTFSKIN